MTSLRLPPQRRADAGSWSIWSRPSRRRRSKSCFGSSRRPARAHQLYLPNNPIYRGAIDSLRAGFVAIWERDRRDHARHHARREFQLVRRPVAAGRARQRKSTDNLAWLFYKDGVRELTITQGFEDTEVVMFLEIIQRARKAKADEDDLVTMLWEADFTFLKYSYVDLLSRRQRRALADGRRGRAGRPRTTCNAAAHEAVEQSQASRRSSTWPTSTRRSTSSTTARSSICRARSRASTSRISASNVVGVAARHLRVAGRSRGPRRGARQSAKR